MKEATELIDAIRKLVEALFGIFGVGGTIIAIIIISGVFLIWKLYNIRKKNKEFDLVINEKNNTISRMQAELRIYRIDEFKRKGWTDAEIDKYVK